MSIPRPRPRKRLSATDRKEAILRAALPLFARHGLRGVTSRELAKVCGVSEALMFYHFPTKEALFDAMMHLYGDSITPEREHLEHLPEPSTLALVQLVFTFVRRVIVREPKQGHEMMHFFYRSFTEDGKFARQFLATGVKDLRVAFEANLTAAKACGDVRAIGVPAHNLFWFTQHVATAACMIRLPAKPVVRYQGSLEVAVEQMVTFILRGMGLTDAALEKYARPETFAAWREPEPARQRPSRSVKIAKK